MDEYEIAVPIGPFTPACDLCGIEDMPLHLFVGSDHEPLNACETCDPA